MNELDKLESTFSQILKKEKQETIKKLEKEKKDQEELKKLNEQKQKYQNMMNINHIKKSDSFKQVKEEYYDLKLLEKEFDDFLEHHQSFPKKDLIETHLKDKNNQDYTPFILRKEMKYLDELLNHKEQQIKK